MSLLTALRETVAGFKSLLTGMRITAREAAKPSITVQYPHETLKMPGALPRPHQTGPGPGDRQVALHRLQSLRARLPERLHRRWTESSGRARRRSRSRVHARLHHLQPLRLLRRGLSERRDRVLQGLQCGQPGSRGLRTHGPAEEIGGRGQGLGGEESRAGGGRRRCLGGPSRRRRREAAPSAGLLLARRPRRWRHRQRRPHRRPHSRR